MTQECKCVVLDETVEGVSKDPRSCPEHAYEAGRRHERNVYLAERAELEERLAIAEAGLWSVIKGTARGWRIEDRLRIYADVARGLGGTYEHNHGSLSGEFVGLRKPR